MNMDDLGDIGDIFESFFGGGAGGRRRTYAQGNDLQILQEITLEESSSGVSKEIQYASLDKCTTCSGLGHEKDSGTKKCEKCDGTVEKLISQSSFALKGSGWYATDYAKKDKKCEPKSDSCAGCPSAKN